MMQKHQSLAWKATFSIKNKILEKLLRFKNTQYLALMSLEFMLSMILLAGLLIYIDPKTNVLQPPFNFIFFGAILIAVLMIYRHTQNFRVVISKKRNVSVKTFAIELVIAGIVAGGAIIYKTPSINTLSYPFNLLLFFAVLCVPLYFYVNEKYFGN